MKSNFVIRVVRKDNGAHIYSHTNDPKQRVERLKYNVLSINGNGSAVFDRFLPFVGCTLTDIEFEVYKQIA
jgi:hypothetical protein